MATYFEFDKKHPHIHYDDVYVKSGKVEDGKLVLSYSVNGLEPLKIDLSKITLCADAELDIRSENAIQNKVVTYNFNALNAKLSAFTFDENDQLVSFKMKDSAIPGLDWNVSIESGQLTMSQCIDELTAKSIAAANATASMLSVS